MKEVTKLHYQLLGKYKELQYKGVLTSGNVSSDKIHINKVTVPGGDEITNYDFWGYALSKDRENYLLSSIDAQGNEIVLRDLLPIYPEGLETVSSKGVAYKIITRPVPARIKPEKKITFKEIVDSLNSVSHSNSNQRKLFIIMSLLSRLTRVNFRVCTPPGYGKDSIVDTMEDLIGSCGSVSNPSVAKLEYMTYLKWLVINEVSNISKADWASVQQFLLDTGAMKESTFKRTRASSGVEEIIDLSKLSIGLFYNDITEYTDQKGFFENKADGNVKDRFIPFRFHGSLNEDFTLINNVNPESFVKDNFDYYRDLAASILYYIEHYYDEVVHYEHPDISCYTERWQQHLKTIFNGLSLYAKDQEEFSVMAVELLNAIKDYNDMLLFPTIYDGFLDKIGAPEFVKNQSPKVTTAIAHYAALFQDESRNDKEREEANKTMKYLQAILKEPLFANKNVLCSSFKGFAESNVSDKKLDEW